MTHGVGRFLPHGDVTKPLKHLAVLRAFPGYCYSLISQYFLLCLFPYLAGDLGRVCGDFPPPCSSMLACTTTAVAAVTPLQDLGQPTTSTVPTSVCHGGWIHPAQHPLPSSVLGEELQQVKDLHPALHKPNAGNWDKPFSELWISGTQLIYHPLSQMDANTEVSKNYSLSSIKGTRFLYILHERFNY